MNDERDKFHKFSQKGNPVGIIDSALVDMTKNQLKMFIYEDKLYIYNGGVYTLDDKGNKYKTIISHYIYPEVLTAARLESVYKLLMTDSTMTMREDWLNTYPHHVINTKSGMLDLKTLELSAHDAEYYHSINQIPFEYHEDFDTDGTVTEEFLRELITDPQDRKMFLEYAGYCLTTDTSRQKFMIIKGQGGTGKSELIHLVERTVGRENTSSLSIQNTNDRFSSAFLFGKLLNANADISSELMSDTSGLKKIIGEDTIRAEYKGGKVFFFKPYVKLLFSANRIPESKDDKTNAYFRRMMILPVNQRCREIKNLSVRLRKETENGVFFHMAVHAVHQMYVEDRMLTESNNSKMAVQQLYEETDSVMAFLHSRTCKDSGSQETHNSLYEAYKDYCYSESRPQKMKNGFYSNLRDKGFAECKIHGTWYFKGLRLLHGCE